MFSIKQAVASASAKLPPFPFEDADGVARELPHLKLLSVELGERILRGDFAVLEEIGADPAVVAQIPKWPAHAVEALIKEWMAHSDVRVPGGAPGKSPTASPSSRSTATSSRRTSGSGGSRLKR